MTTSRWNASCAKLILCAAIALLPLIARADPKVHEHDGVSYVSGGVGTDERRDIEAMSGQFNLKLTMALSDGHFVGDTQVRIQDSKGNTVVDTTADGPLFYAKLPPGTYSVSCSLNGKETKRSATVGSDKQQQLTFTWPSE